MDKKNHNFHSCSSQLVLSVKRDQFTIGLSFLPTNSLLSFQNIYLGSCPNSTTICSSYTLRNIVQYKDICQVIIFSFRPFHSYDIICWLEDKNCTNVALRPIGRWLCHCLENKSWTLRRTSKVMWLIYVSLMWSIMHSTKKGQSHSL